MNRQFDTLFKHNILNSKEHYNFCPKCNTLYEDKMICKCGELIHFIRIDKNIADIILELNKKGYKTSQCCEGHIEDGYFHPYIYFSYLFDVNVYGMARQISEVIESENLPIETVYMFNNQNKQIGTLFEVKESKITELENNKEKIKEVFINSFKIIAEKLKVYK